MAYAIVTKDVSAITEYSANGGATGIDASGADILSKGVVWQAGSVDPILYQDFGLASIDNSTSFDVSLGDVLDPSTTYSLRSFLETNLKTPDIQYVGWTFASTSTFIIDDGYIVGVDTSVGFDYTGEIQYVGWTAGDASTIFVDNGRIVSIDVSLADDDPKFPWSGSIQYLDWFAQAKTLVVTDGRIGEDYYLVTYGDRKEFSTLELAPSYNPDCLKCVWFNKYLDPSGLILSLDKGDGSTWTCGAFNGDASLTTIPTNILDQTILHDVSIDGQFHVFIYGEEYYPVYEAAPAPPTAYPFSDIYPGQLQSEKYIGREEDRDDNPNIVADIPYLIIPDLVEGLNVSFDYTTVDLSSGASFISAITINAVEASAGVTKGYIDDADNLRLKEASIGTTGLYWDG